MYNTAQEFGLVTRMLPLWFGEKKKELTTRTNQ